MEKANDSQTTSKVVKLQPCNDADEASNSQLVAKNKLSKIRIMYVKIYHNY